MKPLRERLIKDRLVYIEWCDARGVTTEWTDLEELEKADTCTCISIGLLLVDSPELIVVLPHFGTDPHNGCGEMVIPRTQVRRMWRLKVGEEINV
jgi:hypothetical protein